MDKKEQSKKDTNNWRKRKRDAGYVKKEIWVTMKEWNVIQRLLIKLRKEK